MTSETLTIDFEQWYKEFQRAKLQGCCSAAVRKGDLRLRSFYDKGYSPEDAFWTMMDVA